MLLEQTQGNLPLWLSPVQVKILPMTDKNIDFAKKVENRLRKEKIRVELDERVESMSKKVRDAQVEKANYMVTIGDKEDKAGTLAVRTRKGDIEFGVELDDFVDRLKTEIKERA